MTGAESGKRRHAGSEPTRRSLASSFGQWPVVVAVIAVRVVQVVIDEIVDVIAVRHGFVPAARAMDVVGRMTGAAMVRRALVGIRVRDLDHVLIDVVVVHVMKVPIMQVVHMIAVTDGRVAAHGTVQMRVIGVRL